MTRIPSPSRLIPFLVASLCSGCAALLNQVMWSRTLSLVFGSSIEAVSAITAIFMAGLALGSALGPRLVGNRNSSEAALLYARVEFGIAASALTLAFVLPALEPLRASIGAAPVWALTVALLLVPSGLMGTTLVVQCRSVSESPDHAFSARAAGLLFAANTFGAVAGAYGSVLVLVPRLGVQKTIVVASLLNLIAALVAMFWARRPVGASARADSRPVEAPERTGGRQIKALSNEPLVRAPPPPTNPGLPLALVMAALFAAGFAGLANEVAWTRAFILVAGPTVHAFAFVLGAIVLGLACGALVSSSLLPFLPDPRLVFALAQAGVAGASALVIRALSAMPLLYGEEVRRLVDQPGALIHLQAERSLFLLFPAAALSGALFPLGLRLLRGHLSVTRAMGVASALNTAGAIAGASLAGFVLLPAIGLDRTLRLAALVSAFSSVVMALHCRLAPRLIGVLAGVFAVGLVATTPSFDPELFAGGAYKYTVYDTDLSVEDVLRRGELVFYAEGRVANVSVKRVAANFSLAVDGKVDATSGGDMLTQRLLAHVPFLISEKPQTALVIGLGSGVTASAALTHNPRSVTAVEISPEVVEAARRFFAGANNRVLEDPRLRLITGDARQHVLSTKDRYDVIISEPSNPWMAGVSGLFTREFFASVKSRLAEGGVFCQWGHLYNMSEADLATLLATFSDVFPGASVFVISEADILIVGGDVSPKLNERRLSELPEKARLDLAASGLTPSALGAIPRASLGDFSTWLGGARRHTDDAPVLDFSAPLSIHAQTATANRRRLVPDETETDAASIKLRLELLNASTGAEWIYDLSARAVTHGLADRSIAQDFVRSAIRLHRAEPAEATLFAAIARAPSPALFVAQALLYWNTSRPDLALQSLESASRLDPREVSAYLLAAEIQSAAGNLQVMRKLVGRALALDGGNAEAIGLAAEAELKDGRLEPAARLADGALRLDPKESRALEVRALALAQLGRPFEARNGFIRLLAVLPDAAIPRNNFGVFELQQGNASAASRLFQDAVDLDPSNREGYRGLKEAAQILGRNDLTNIAEQGLARLAR